jgi:hypothetical protein
MVFVYDHLISKLIPSQVLRKGPPKMSPEFFKQIVFRKKSNGGLHTGLGRTTYKLNFSVIFLKKSPCEHGEYGEWQKKY